VKVEVDAEAELAERDGVRSIPTFLFVPGGEVADQISGVLSRPELEKRCAAL